MSPAPDTLAGLRIDTPPHLRIATFNVNGIRAALRRGFRRWIETHQPDVVALQEVRCPVDQLPLEAFTGYHVAYDPGVIPGRNGVAVMTRQAPAAVRIWGETVHLLDPHGSGGLAPVATVGRDLARELRHFGHEGRHLEVDLADHPLTVASLYLPKGGTPFSDEVSLARLERKMRFLAGFSRQMSRSRRAALAAGREYLVMGDFNIAHQRLDVNNPSTKNRSEGFLPQEREWFAAQLSPRTLVDVVRRLRPDEQGPYTWWSWMGQAWNRDTGWRIDYHLASPGLARRAVAGGTHRDATYEERISDHSPVVVDYSL
ncbi:exodeoxyribonuclease III [Aestuariimicrobium ganziense]|uniref:exodeoxyribonuclease III n=1 Tax=Aestuariimicrobium ganziense TaxID=2773677 RepID=UPI002E27BF3F|nr:exodeoxyribonuclease III [Aestuariimicrobium ganziense]